MCFKPHKTNATTRTHGRRYNSIKKEAATQRMWSFLFPRSTSASQNNHDRESLNEHFAESAPRFTSLDQLRNQIFPHFLAFFPTDGGDGDVLLTPCGSFAQGKKATFNVARYGTRFLFFFLFLVFAQAHVMPHCSGWAFFLLLHHFRQALMPQPMVVRR